MVEWIHFRSGSETGLRNGLDADVHYMYKIYHVQTMRSRAAVSAKKDLTSFLREPISRPDLEGLLSDAGLELWQDPEGFWAIRLRPPQQPTQPTDVAKERRR